jgi:ATP-dependent helicase/nuclease subunit B
MTVRYILGRAGSGKTNRMLAEIKHALQSSGPEHLLLLVPEQFTLQAERDLLQKLQLPGIIRAEVMSFTRLAARVLDQVGGKIRTVLTEQGKNMVLRKIIDESGRELTIYQAASSQPGFTIRLSEILAELKGQGIKPENLRGSVNDIEEHAIRQKINDISLLWERFDQYLEGNYLDGEDYLNLFIDKIPQADSLRTTHIWIDGFDTFAPQNIKIIGQLMAAVPQLSISVTMDKDGYGRDAGLFEVSQTTLKKIHALAQQQGKAEEYIWMEEPHLEVARNQAISHLERELYAYPGIVYPDRPQGLELFLAANPNSEIEYAAAEILALVRDRGWRWRDITLVCNDLKTYGSIIKRVLAEYDIPYFMDQKRDIMSNAIIILILTSLEVIHRGYRYQDLFTLLKTGFSCLDADLIEITENLVLQYGIEGRRWREEIVSLSPEHRDRLDLIRQKTIQPLIKLEKKLKGKNSAASIVKAHYEYLEEMQVQSQLEKWIERLSAQGRYVTMRENAQIWNIVMEVFDQLTEILNDREINLPEYQRLLEAGFTSLEIGVIPTTIDQVLVGDVRRSKSQQVKGLIVVGVNDGILPSARIEEGLLTEAEKELLLDHGIDLVFEPNQIFAEERLLIYSALSKPTDCLSISYALADSNGQALRPSLFIERLKHLFPRLESQSDIIKNTHHLWHQIGTPTSTYKYFVENLRLQLDGHAIEDVWGDVNQWYACQPAWKNTLEMLRAGLHHRNQMGTMGSAKAARLYAQPIHTNVSRLEQFVKCPFAHLVSFGLKPQPRKKYLVEAPDMGELFHRCLYSFGKHLERENLSWLTIEHAQCDQLVDAIMEDVAADQGNGVFSSSFRYRYLVQRLKRIGRRAVWTLTQHLQQGNFAPFAYEVSFGLGGLFPAVEIELGDGQRLYLQGRIDRVDLLEHDGEIYVKIIDYKSGLQNLKLSDVYNGLSLQLMVYLQAVVNGYRDSKGLAVKPAGAFYFHIDDPIVNTEAKLVERVEAEIAAKLKMKGIALKDVTIVRNLDHNIDNGSNVIPAALKTNGDFAQRSSVLAAEDIISLFDHLQRLLGRIGAEIMAGQVRIEPVKNGRQTACQYCAYLPICQFDRKIPGNNYRLVKQLTDQEVIERIRYPKEVAPNGRLD